MARGVRMMIGAVVFGTAAGLSIAQPVSPPTEQISADCGAAIYATDQLVCSDATLRALDAEMLRLWTRAGAERHLDGAARSAQLHWFRSRSLCAFEPDHRSCAIAAYRSRIVVLRAMLGEP